MKKALLILGVLLLINFSSLPEDNKGKNTTKNLQFVKLLLASINPVSLFAPEKIATKRSPFTYDRDNDIWYFEFAEKHSTYLAAFRPGKNSVQIRIFPPTSFNQPYFIGKLISLPDCIIVRGVYCDFSKHDIKRIPKKIAEPGEKEIVRIQN